MNKSHLSQTDIGEEVKTPNMSTTRVEMTRTYTDTYIFEIPTHVAKEIGDKQMWIETQHKDYWELMWEDQEDAMKIEPGDVDQVHNDFEGAEFTVIDKEAELKKELEWYKKRYSDLIRKDFTVYRNCVAKLEEAKENRDK